VYVSVGLVAGQRHRPDDSRDTEDRPDPDEHEEAENDPAPESFAHAFAAARSDGEAADRGGRRGDRRRGGADLREGPSAPAAATTSATVSTGPAESPRSIRSTRVEL